MGLFSWLFLPLLAEALQLHTLSSGVKVWTQENAEPPQMIAFRVIGEEKKYAYDIFGGGVGEIEQFFSYIQQTVAPPFQIVAVGDFEEKKLIAWMEGLSPFLKKEHPPINYYHIPPKSIGEITLFYPMTIEPINNEETLKQFWSRAIFQKMVEKRLKASIESTGGQWDTSEEAGFFPKKTCGGKAKCDPQECLTILIKLLTAIQEIKKEGFTVAEWKEAQSDMIGRLKASLRLPPDSSMLATYFSEHIASGATTQPLAFPFFVSSSIQAIKELPRSSVHQIAEMVIQDKSRRVQYSVPHQMDEVALQQVLAEFGADAFTLSTVEEDTLAVDDAALAPFNQIPVTPEENKLIWELIDKLGNKGYLGLLGVKPRMDKIKEKIQFIHPLRFLGSIFSDPYLKKCMKKAFEKGPVKSRFLSELGENFLKEFPSNNVYPLVPGFCKKVGADPKEVNMFIQSSQWEKLVEYLMNL